MVAGSTASSAVRSRRARRRIDPEELADNAREASEFLKALANETRLIILCMLIDGEKSVSQIERKLDARQPFVSQQLARLRADDLVEARREGKNVYYSIARPEVVDIVSSLHQAFCRR